MRRRRCSLSLSSDTCLIRFPPLQFRSNFYYPRESEGICFHRRWFGCVCVSVCLSVTTITNKCRQICTKFYAKFPRGKGRPSSCFVRIGKGMWK